MKSCQKYLFCAKIMSPGILIKSGILFVRIREMSSQKFFAWLILHKSKQSLMVTQEAIVNGCKIYFFSLKTDFMFKKYSI